MISAARQGWGDRAAWLARYCVRMAVVGGLVLAVLVAGLAWRPALYTASVRLVVVPAAGPDDGRAARNQAELLRDPGLVRRLAPRLAMLARRVRPGWRGRLGLGEGAADEAGLVRRVSAALSVDAVGDTDVIVLALRWPDRDFAAGALGLVVAAYGQAASGAVGAQARLGAAQEALDAARAELAQTEARAPADDAAVLEAARQRLEARVDAVRGEADTLRLDRALAQQRLDTLEASFKAGGWVDAADGDAKAAGGARLASGFAVLLDKRQALLGAGQADGAAMRALDREIARVRQQNYALARQALAGRMAGMDDRLGVLAAAAADDGSALRALDRRVADAAVQGEALRTRTQRVAAARLAVAQARDAAEGGWQAAGLARVVSAAVPPAEAAWPGPGVRLALATVLAVLAGLGSGVWAEARRQTIDGPADVTRRLGLEVLARLEELPAVRAL